MPLRRRWTEYRRAATSVRRSHVAWFFLSSCVSSCHRRRRATADERASLYADADGGTPALMAAARGSFAATGRRSTRPAAAPQPVRGPRPRSLATGKVGRAWRQGVYPARMRAESRSPERGIALARLADGAWRLRALRPCSSTPTERNGPTRHEDSRGSETAMKRSRGKIISPIL